MSLYHLCQATDAGSVTVISCPGPVQYSVKALQYRYQILLANGKMLIV